MGRPTTSKINPRLEKAINSGITTLVCKKCNTEKSILDDFYQLPKNKLGVAYACKDCRQAKQQSNTKSSTGTKTRKVVISVPSNNVIVAEVIDLHEQGMSRSSISLLYADELDDSLELLNMYSKQEVKASKTLRSVYVRKQLILRTFPIFK